MATLLVLCRFLHFIVVLLMFGACVFRPWLLGAEPQPVLDRQLLRITRGLAWTALASAVTWLLLITASMAGSWPAAEQPPQEARLEVAERMGDYFRLAWRQCFAPKIEQIKRALFAGQKIAAIKIYREQTNSGLREAKEAVEKLEARLK